MRLTSVRAGSLGEVVGIGWVAAQLGVILVLARAFQLENPAFFGVVLPLAFGGFLVHHWLPRRYQPLFFAALSIAGIGLVFGPVAGAWLVGVGLGLIALCHVPIAFRWRLVLIGLAAGALMAMRATWWPTPWPGVIWPILGSMFMFRLAIYIYDLKHAGPASPGFVLSYFFLLPNSVFLLFPVIDFQTFRRTHYDKPAFEIYGEGVRWMFRGLTHLVIYRLIYQYVALSPADVTSTAGIVQYLVGNYGLYLRVSGQFHVIVGLLHLFGFRLPETHRFFYLASSFSDLWRRINIYWKDFMQKMVYLPVIFGLKPRGETTALVGATVCVVGATWFLHSYQWFWLLGTWLFSATDMVFWGILGVLLIASTLREQRRGRVRQLTAQTPPAREAWRHALQTAGMFGLMIVLWGFWTSPSFEDFRVMLRAATLRTFDVAVVLGTLAVVAAAAYISRRFSFGAPSALAVRPRWQHPLVVSALPLALFLFLGDPALEGRVPGQVQAVVRQARVAELNKNDAERMQRGYYEQIVGVNRLNGELWEVYARADVKQEADDIVFGDMRQARSGDDSTWMHHDDVLGASLRPLNRTMFKGGRFTTNQWGMRDKDYGKSRPPGTRRIAVLGQSYTLGEGVNDGEIFEALIEERLNREWSKKTGLRYEVLNFSMSGYSLDKQVLILQNGRVGEFQPDVVLVVGNPMDDQFLSQSLLRRLQMGLDLPEAAAQWLIEAGVTPETTAPEAVARLQPRGNDLARWALKNIVSEARRVGAQPVYVLIPMPRTRQPSKLVPFASLAAEAGFLVIDLEDVYSGHDSRSLTLSEADFHPNPEGHRIIATRLYKEMALLPGVLAPDDPVDAENKARLWTEWNRERLSKTEVAEVKPAQPIEGWDVETREGSVATLRFLRADNWMRITIARIPKPSALHVRLRNAPVPITDGHRYVLNFWMKADATRPVACGVARGMAPGEALGESTKLQAATWWEEFNCSFTATGTDSNALIFLDLGMSDAALELSKVQLRDLSTGAVVMSTDPAWRPSAPKVR